MRRRGGYGFHRQPYTRDEGSSSYSNSDRDDDAASGSSRGRGGRRGRKWPPELKGKEIGFYFRDRARSRKIANRMEVSLDPARERQIRELLNSIDLTSLQDEKHEQKLVPSSSGTRYSSLQDEYKPKKDFSKDAGFQYSSTQEKFPAKMESDSDFSTLTSPKVKMEMNCEIGEGSCGYISKQGDSEVKQEYIRDFGESYFSEKREWELKLDISDDFKKDSDLRSPSFSECDNKIPAEDRYKHIGDSVFKRKFLQNIKGNIVENLERSLSRKNVLDCDKELDRTFKAGLLAKQNSSHYKKMMEFRKTLPSFKMQDQILKLVEENQVTVISGETGCGKTTQVAQFILDDYIMKEKGSMCHIICTQPRRISATSVAARVADERDEICGRDSVGYQIRLEKKVPRTRGSILFCTTGVMLQWMKSDAALGAVSHLVLDEIHERDVTSDFIITILKDIIPKRPDLKIILMSATLNAEKFATYFNGCPCINIPGFTYPVKEYYLEDVLQMTRFRIQPQRNREIQGWKRHLKFAKAKIRKIEEFKDFIEPYVRHLASEGKYSNAVLDMLKDQSSEEINLDLMAALIQHICIAKDNGAILVFLPGWDKISALHKLLADSGNFPSSRYLIIPLHSLMPTVIQKSVFDRPPKGVRKIVIATNIAETSITIDDVVYVIDCGKIKLKNFDVDHNIQTLKPEWVSVANARQRRGRAGRVQPGECYHLYTKAREMTLANYPLPEMLRTRLDEVILQIKILQLGKVKPFLSRVMDPPDHRAVDLSITLLMNLNALDADENLTPLGFHLAKLPVDPQTGKMILMGALFSCVDPIFSIAASLGFKDAFHIPLGREDEVIRKKRELAKGSKSDHLVLAEALKQWELAEEMGRGRQFCWDYFLSPNTLQLLRDMKRQFAKHLHEMDFLNSRNPKHHESNLNSHNMSLVKAIICAGLYPNVATVRSVKKKKNIVIAKVSTPEDGTVHIHPRSINEKETMYESPFLLYHLKLKSTNINLHDTTMMYPLPLLFFGQGVDICNDDGFETIAVDKFVRFKCQERTANLVKELRTRLDQLLEFKITHPGTINWNRNSTEGAILRAIIELITSEDKLMMMEAQEEGGDDFSD